MRVLIFSLLIILSFHSIAQQAFYPNTVIDKTFGVKDPYQTIMADADSDGDFDIFVRSYSDNNLIWYPNIDGQGTHGPRNVIASGVNSDVFDVGDINGDGHVDIVRGKTGSVSLVWDANDGNGNFDTTSIIDNTIINPRTIILVDIDGDSDLDIFIHYHSEYRQHFGWFENLDGLGNFGELDEIGSNGIGGQAKTVVADLDGDNNKDILVYANTTNSIFWYKNLDGLGTFSESIHIDNVSFERVFSILTTDIDGDSDQDIIISRQTPGSEENGLIVMYENLDGNGNFGPATIVSEAIYDAQFIKAVDLDSDGDQDLLIANTEGLNAMWLQNDGNGNFGLPIIFEEYVYLPNHISVGDIDNNGTPDIVLTAYGEDTVTTYKNLTGDGTLEAGVHINSIIEHPRKVVIADFDGDGDNDIATISEDDKVAWHENLDGLGTFGQQNVLAGNLFSGRFLEALDYDNDGDLDLMFGYGGAVGWFENLDGAGNFSESQTLIVENDNSLAVTFLDVDNDLNPDLILLNSTNLAWYKNIDGVIQHSSNGISLPFRLSQIFKIDVNGDGFIDLVGTGSAYEQLIWLPNLGNGSFGPAQVIDSNLPNIRFAGVAAADIDGDGDLDLISGSPENNTILWYENLDGQGTFGEANIIATNIKMNKAIVVFDADLDGDPDIIVADELTNTVQFIENIDGGSSFADPTVLFETDDTYNSNIVYGELNGDNKQDLAISNFYNGSILWYENLGVLSNVITGNITIDLDSNGCDSGDPNMENLLIKTGNDTYTFSTVTDVNGGYSISVPEGIYTTRINSALPTYFGSEPESHESEFVGINNIDNKDFCIVATETIEDININLFPIIDARPGFQAVYQLVYGNVGTVVMDGNIELNFDGVRLEYLESTEPASSSNSGQFTFEYTNLLPLETRTIEITFLVAQPPIAQIDDSLVFSGQINPVSNDINPEDNSFDYSQIVIGSFDPNDIVVLEGTEVHIDHVDNYLHYIIRFQNTGTASAINVMVLNELDEKLDWDTFQLLNTSHDSRVEITGGKTVQFIFDYINLPAILEDEEGSNGYILYKIKPKTAVTVGDQVRNNAKIYFDFNPFILTNTVTTTFVEQLGTVDLKRDIIQIYPNPVETELFISGITNFSKVSLYDLTGEKIIEQKIFGDSVFMDVSPISVGVYILKFDNYNGNLEIRRFIKK